MNSPKPVVKVTAKPQDSSFKPPIYNMANNSSAFGVCNNECKEYMMSLEKELDIVLKSKPSTKEMINIGTKF